MQELIEKYNMNVNGRGYKGQTPLTLAVSYSEKSATVEMVELLLAKGANKEILDDYGKTAYDYAIESNNKEIISLLED